MKKIAVLRAYPKDAAFTRVVTVLAQKYEVDCYIWDRQRDFKPAVDIANVKYNRCGIRSGYYSLSTFLKMFLFEAWLSLKLLTARMDCIHAIDLDTGFIGLLIAKLRSKAFVYQCLDPYYAALPAGWPGFLGRLAQRMENIVISHADFFVITDLLRMPQHEGAKPKRVVEFANVPPLNVIQLQKTDHGEFVAGYIGSLIEGRNLAHIVEAIGELKGQGIKLIIGGFGPLEDKIKEISRKYENVFFTSWISYEKVLEMERTFDVFVYITDKMHLGQRWVSPNKLFESMAFGTPIIVGEGTLAAERVGVVGNGIIIRYGSKEELQKAVLDLKNNEHLARVMGERGRMEFERNWGPETMKSRLLEGYKEIISEL